MEFDSFQFSGRFFSALARDLKSLALSNIQFFQDGKLSYHAKFHVSFSLLYDYLDLGIEPNYRELSSHVHLFDYSPDVKGNGYRSLLHVVQKCCLHLLQLVRYISSMRDSILFRKKFYAQELEAYVSALGQLRAVLYYALKLINYCQDGDLFTNDEVVEDEVARSLMLEIEELNQECFYGRCIGFQFCASMLRPLQALGIAMASYSEGYLETSSMMQMATSVFNSGKYFLDPELRAEQIVKATRTSDIRFCKALWGLAESGFMKQLPAFVCPSVEVDELFPLGPDAFELPLEDGSDTVVITPPCAHTGPGHVYVRLISAHLRDGQQSLKKTTRSKTPPTAKPRTAGLVIHIHGGGFVAHSSKSHEVYLRDWAHVFNVPILSIDYSLSPEMPFPRALEECFYAYAWVVKNCEQLGSTGASIVMVGDSAGGNLAIATAMRAASFGIRRPEGIVSIYGVTMVSYTPSPARLLSLMDPLLSFGLLSRCLAAYAGVNEEHPLATPQNEEFHSKASLSSLQIQSMEASGKDWIIIAQNQQECMEIDQKLATASPAADHHDRSVVDSLEDSFHGDSNEDSRNLERSDTVESEEVEIFSQLAAAGSCVFPKDGKKGKATKEDNADSQSQDAKDNRAKDDEGSTSSGLSSVMSQDGKIINTLEGIQETAKNMMAGAQSMFSSLTSYIPKRSKQSSPEPSNPGTTHDLPMAITPDIDCFVDLSYNSDPVDNVARVNGDLEDTDDQNTAVPSDSGHSMLEPQVTPSLSETNDLVQDDRLVHIDSGLLEAGVGENDAQFSPSAFIRDSNFEAGGKCPNQHPATSKVGSGSKINHLSFSDSIGSVKEQKSSSELADSCLFSSALGSPISGVTGHAMTLNCLNSPNVSDNQLVSDSQRSRPTLGVSPNTEIAVGSGTDDCSVSAIPPTCCATATPLSLSSHPAPSTVATLDVDCRGTSSPHLATNNDSLVSALLLNHGTLSPNSPPSFSEEDFSCDPNSLRGMPSLPPERKELLEDAIEAAEFWGDDSSSEKHLALPSQSNPGAVTMGCANTISTDPRPASEIPLASQVSEQEDDENTLKDVNPGQMEMTPVSTDAAAISRPVARPPSELKLTQTTSTIVHQMSEATADSGLCSDPMEGDQDEPDFDKSCLEFLTPSSTLNDDYLANQMMDGIFRSESAPALSSLLTPSPATGSKVSFSVSSRPGLNGLRMGMSPSDFKRRTFTTQSPLNTMKKATVVKNPYMSPLLAPKELLRGLPPVTVVGCNLDPLLDDSIMFAKRLRSFDLPVTLHLVDDLPHGFLNFALISNEAKQASRFCAQKVLDLMDKDI